MLETNLLNSTELMESLFIYLFYNKCIVYPYYV